jgi:hypothetical protein
MTTAGALTDPRVRLGAGTAWLAGDRELAGPHRSRSLLCGSVVAWPKDPYSGDLSPWPVPADPGQRRMQHPIT